MKLYIWRHNRKFHSYSMIDEPCVHQDFYTNAVAAVLAESREEAYELLEKQNSGWQIADLRELEPQVIDCNRPGVVFEKIQGV